MCFIYASYSSDILMPVVTLLASLCQRILTTLLVLDTKASLCVIMSLNPHWKQNKYVTNYYWLYKDTFVVHTSTRDHCEGETTIKNSYKNILTKYHRPCYSAMIVVLL